MELNYTIFLAFGLLAARVWIVWTLVEVVRLQYKLIAAKNDPDLAQLRVDLFNLTLVFLAGQILPVILDVSVIFQPRVDELIKAYAISNTISTVAAVYILKKIYRERAGKR